MGYFSEYETRKKANRMNREKLTDWILEIQQDNERQFEIIKRYEDLTNAHKEEDAMAIYNPKTMELEHYWRKKITTTVNGTKFEYRRYNYNE